MGAFRSTFLRGAAPTVISFSALTRSKFLLFALLVLGLWGAHLFLLSPAVGSALVDQATSHVVSAPASVALRLESMRSELQAAVLKLASTPAITNPGPRTGKPEAPTADRFTQVRGAVMEALPEGLRDKVLVGVGNEVGALMANGTTDPAAPAEGFDARAAGASGGKGEVMEAYGASYLVYSVPLFGVDKGEVRGMGAAFVGLPLAVDPQALVESVAKELGLSAVGLSVGGKVIASAGARKALVGDFVRVARPGQAIAAEKGAASTLGPVKLPILTAGDPMGGQATLELGVRRDIPGTPYEVIAIASVRPAMETLGAYQKTALLMFAGLLVAAIAFTLLLGGKAAEEEEEAYAGPRVSVPVAQISSAKNDGIVPLPIASSPPPPEATADDFHFGPPTPGPSVAESPQGKSGNTREAEAFAPPVPTDEPEDSFAALGPARAAPPPPPVRVAPPVMTLGDEDDEEHQRTSAYAAHGYKSPTPMAMASTQSNPALDPFAMAGGLMSEDEQMQGDNPDATRVAIIPQELLKASARGNSKENPMGAMPKVVAAPMPRVASAVAPAGAVGGEDAHFQEVFRDFVATRERCGEAADGLTFDKFVAKLRKNKDQLIVKYSCKTVRFQVYVKEGKAALKATPVKE